MEITFFVSSIHFKEDIMKSVASLLVHQLKEFGISHVFGIPGKAISPLVLEADRQGLQYVLCRHEAGAGFASAGFALGSGKFGVALGTSGPGGTNMLTAAGQAKAFNLPVMFITGHPSIGKTGRALGQDSSIFGTDLVKMFEPVTLFSACVERGDLFPLYFRHALEKMYGSSKGPVHLSLPYDVSMEKITPFELDKPHQSVLVSPEINRILPMIARAKSPAILLGKGVHASQAYEEVLALAKTWNIPVMTTPGGKGSFPTNNPLSLGGFGLAASEEAYKFLRHGCDLMIILGTKLSDMSLAGVTMGMYPKEIIQFDCDPTFVGKSLPVPTIAVIGDLRANLQELLRTAQINPSRIPFITCVKKNTDSQEVLKPSPFISTSHTMKILRKCLPEDAMVISDDGSHAFYGVKYFEILKAGTFYFDDVFGAMGHAIGMAIGAKIAQPNRHVLCITGDGCLMMQGTEISTAVCNKISAIFLVINNGRLDMVEKAMKFGADRVVGAIYEVPLNATQFGQSLGATSFCCHKEEEIEAALMFALTHDGPTVIEVVVDPNEIPPTLSREKTATY